MIAPPVDVEDTPSACSDVTTESTTLKAIAAATVTLVPLLSLASGVVDFVAPSSEPTFLSLAWAMLSSPFLLTSPELSVPCLAAPAGARRGLGVGVGRAVGLEGDRPHRGGGAPERGVDRVPGDGESQRGADGQARSGPGSRGAGGLADDLGRLVGQAVELARQVERRPGVHRGGGRHVVQRDRPDSGEDNARPSAGAAGRVDGADVRALRADREVVHPAEPGCPNEPGTRGVVDHAEGHRGADPDRAASDRLGLRHGGRLAARQRVEREIPVHRDRGRPDLGKGPKREDAHGERTCERRAAAAHAARRGRGREGVLVGAGGLRLHSGRRAAGVGRYPQ